MTSSMLSGERRWASARRGGMTVLGKVAVPKPINLPSQRLENHGLDPNVEIVPKGTHSWGSRSSSSSSNAWGSSSLSPNTDGGTGSPSYLSGQPSSGGTGTRPSTAGSERGHDPITNAWGSNSRPSSSSGALTSNQTAQTALRPRSAETRPGSSQLSRFAEPLTDNSVAWSGNGTAEKLGVTSSKTDGFSLSSGDFPTLGSEKDNSGKNADSQDHGSRGRPGSSTGVASGKEHSADSSGEVSVDGNVKIGTSGTWRNDNSLYGEDGARSNVEKWHADHQPYPNHNIPPQHYDAWHGPVNNHPGGVWYRGPPGGPPFGSPVAPGGFPMEPFPYYRPQMPPPPLANPQPVPPPGTGPRGPHPKNGDMYRPHVHDAYIRPGMPLRPGFYPGPVPYDNYYGPPLGYCNSNDRDVPFMGMAMGPGAYNRYAGQNVPDPGNSLGRTSGYGPTSKAMVSEQVEAVHPQDTRGPYKVLLKQHDNWEGKDEEHKRDETTIANASYHMKGEHLRKSSWENGWEADDKKGDEMDARRMKLGGGASCEAVDNQAVHLKIKSSESVGSLNASGESSVKKFEHPASTFPEASADPKDSSLIQKIEGLNAKVRAIDVKQDVKSVPSREEQKNKFQVGDVMVCHSANEVGASLPRDKDYGSGIINSVPHEDRFAPEVKNLESTVVTGTAISRRSTHGRADQRGRGRFNAQEADGWRKKTHFVGTQNLASTGHNEISSVSHGPDHNSVEAAHNSVLHPSAKADGDSMPPVSDPNDGQLQCAKMRDLAKRLKQREKEEEERTREQKAKALAKLEELNRRTQAMEVATLKLEIVPTSATQSRQEIITTVPPAVIASKSCAPSLSLGSDATVANNGEKLENATGWHEESVTAAPPVVIASKSRASSSAPGSNRSMVAQSSESSANSAEKSASMASNASLGTPKIAYNQLVVVHEQSKPFQQDVNHVDAAHCSNIRGHDSGSTSKQKRIGYRQKQNSAMDKNSNEKSITSSVTGASKGRTDIATTSSESIADEAASNSETNLSVNLSVPAESSAHHRKKNKSGKNRHKVDEAALPSKESKAAAALETSESVKLKTSEMMLDHSSVQSPTSLNNASQSLEPHSSLANEEGHIKSNHQWKSQHPRRPMRNPQGNKSADKNHSSDAVVWAPVKSQTKIEVSDEANKNVSVEGVSLSAKSDQLLQNNPRNKRAEMERYIPKPVAKELSQQGSSHQAVAPLSNQVAQDEIVERSESGSVGAESLQTSSTAAGKAGFSIESRNGDVRQSRPGKVHGSWRQRGAAESTSNPSRSSQRSIEDHSQRTDETSMKEQPRHSDELSASDGWNMPENPDTAAVPFSRDQGMHVRGKRHPYKGHKGMGHNHNPDEKRTVGDHEKVYIQSITPEVHHMDSSVVAKENHAAGERSTSHWQPKAQPLPATNQRGTQPDSRKESTHQDGRPLLPQPDKDATGARPQSHHDQSSSEKNKHEETPGVGRNQEHKRERRMGGHRGRAVSPVELSSHSDQHMSAGLRKNGNASSRYSREHESHGEWGGSGKDNKQHNPPATEERQRHNLQYEYQPVGPHNNNKPNNFEPPKDRPRNSSSRYLERGQNHSRRGGGNFYGRQTGNVQVDGGYE